MSVETFDCKSCSNNDAVDESEIQSVASENSSDTSSGSNDLYEFNSNRSLSSNDSSINTEELRVETRLNLGEEYLSSDDSSLESNDLEDIAFVNNNYGDSLENEGHEKDWTDQKVLVHDPTRSIASHFVLNNYFRILNRKIPMHENTKSSFIMQQLVSSTDSPAVSLMHPESMLMPSTYCKNYMNLSSIGCIPNFLYRLGPEVSHNGIASVEKHNCVRLRDGSLQTSTSDQFLHFAFDVKMNCKLNHKSSDMLFKRGFEHLMQQGITGWPPQESVLEFDEFDSSRKIKELSALMEEKPWQIFYTHTSNDNGTPGLAPVFLAFKIASQHYLKFEELDQESTYAGYNYWDVDELEYEEDRYKEYCEKMLNVTNRIHDRTFKYLRALIESNKCDLLPKVDGNFDKCEYQSKDSLGNRYHIHGGYNTMNSSFSDLRKMML